MTDQPSIEQQLADVIRPMFACDATRHCETCSREALAYARTIIAAVNEGRCPAIVPEGACVCGEPLTLGVAHRLDGPCFHYDDALDQLIAGLGRPEASDE